MLQVIRERRESQAAADHNTVFAQLLRFIPLAQLTGRQSLRDIVNNLGAQGRKLYHLGVTATGRSRRLMAKRLPVAGPTWCRRPNGRRRRGGDAVDDGGERGRLVLLDETPAADVLEPPVGDVGASFSRV